MCIIAFSVACVFLSFHLCFEQFLANNRAFIMVMALRSSFFAGSVVKNGFLSLRTYASPAVLSSAPIAKRVILPDYQLTALPSGFRVASESLDMPTATVGVWIDAGSRYEDESNNGVAHFLEHMAFKGTRRRKQSQLEVEVENMGAHLNAYTSREQTVYYAKCFTRDLEGAVEMLSDILLNSVYGENEIWRERQVIIREAEEVAQNMQEVVFDHLHAGAYAGCSLARTILGTDENIRSMKREQLVEYIGKYYKGPRMLLAAAGGVDHSHLVELAKKYFGKIEHGGDHVLDYEPGIFRQSHQLIEDEQMEMVFGSLAVEGTSWTSEDNIPVQVVNTTSYKDTGLTGLYFCAEPDALAHLAESVCKEWRQLCEEVDEDELERAKRSLLTNSLLMLDGSTPICEDIGRQLLCYDRRMSTEELEEKINSITPDTIRDIGRRYFVNKPFSYVIIASLSPPTLVCPCTLSSSTTSTAPVVEEKRKAPPLLPLPNRWIYKQWKVESIAQTTTLSSSDVGGGNRSSNSEQFPTDPSQRRKKAAKVVVNKRRVVEEFLLVGGGGDVKEVAAGTVTLPEGAGGVEIVDDRSDSNRMVAACVAASSATVTTAAAAYLNHNQTGLTGGLGGGGGCKKDMATSFNPSTASKGVSMATVEVEQLRQQLQTVVENGDLSASNACAGQLENAVLSKETLEATRIGRFVNDIRKQTAQQWPDFSKRCRALIKQWQKVAEYRPSSSCEGSSNGGTPQLVSPALKRGLTPRSGAVTTPGKRATPQQQQRVTSTGLCPPDARQNTGRSSSTLSSSASVSPVENGVPASSGSYAPLPQTGKKMSPKQNVAAIQQPSMHKSASVGAAMNRLDGSSTMRHAGTMLNGIAEVGAVAGGARLASGPSYANIAMEFGAEKPQPMSLTAPSMLLTNNPPLTLKLKRSASGVQRLTSSMSPPPDNAMASASTSAATVAQQPLQLQQQQSVHAARKNVQSTAQLVAQLSKALPQNIGIDLNNKQQHQQMGPGQNVVTKKISSDPIRTSVSTASENTKRRHHKRKGGRASEERTEATFVKQMKMNDTGEVKEDEKLQEAKRGQGVEKAGPYEKEEGKTEAMREQLRQADEIDKEGRKGRKKKKDKQHLNDTTGTKFNWFAEFPLSTAASTSSSVEQHAEGGAGPAEGILANMYASPTRSFVVPAYERQLLLLPYMDIGLPDWRVHNFPQSDRFLFPEPNEWHKKPS